MLDEDIRGKEQDIFWTDLSSERDTFTGSSKTWTYLGHMTFDDAIKYVRKYMNHMSIGLGTLKDVKGGDNSWDNL